MRLLDTLKPKCSVILQPPPRDAGVLGELLHANGFFDIGVHVGQHLTYEVSGPGSVIAVGNGDPTSHLPFQAVEMPAFNGLCQAIVRAEAGKIGKLEISTIAEGLAGGTVVVEAK